MKKGSLLLMILLYFSYADAQKFTTGGIFKSEIKPRTTGQQVLPPVNPKDFTKFKAEVWPNPATSNFNLKVESPSDDQISVYLSDLTGKRVMKFKVLNKQTFSFGEALSPGLYIMEVMQGKEVKSFIKIIKQ
ncbi:MAG TPA: T9SS type A sorting domain-containing protein [Lentimicrobium sp.]|jgi:hypothetical protein|nr:T9SS type A sorting domain-containing protein [Lentimicrobium sp.]